MIAVLLVALAVAAATWVAGWWGVALVALVCGAVWYDRRAVASRVTLGAVLGWAALLIVDASGGGLGRVMGVVGGVLRIPGVALLLLTLAFVALLAWSASTVASEFRRTVTR